MEKMDSEKFNEFSRQYFKKLDEWSLKKAEEQEKVDPVGSHKMKEKINKIIDFWQKEMPKEYDFMTKNYFFREACLDVAEEFFKNPSNLNKDYKHFPWLKKMKERLKEMFGLILIEN